MKVLLAIIVMLNGKAVEFKDAKPFMENKIVMVPLRAVLEKMGAKVKYRKNNDVEVRYANKTIWMEPRTTDVAVSISESSESDPMSDAGRLCVRLKQSLLSNPPANKNGNVFVPLRFVTEIFDMKVTWDHATRTVIITTPKSQPSTPEAKPPAIKAGEIEVRVASDKNSYRAGEPVKFTIIVVNQDDQPRTLNFRNGQSFDISVTPTNQDEVLWRWDWSHDRMFTEALREQTLETGETLTFNAIWKQTDNEGKPMPRGEYSLQAKLTTETPTESPLRTLRLTDGISIKK